MLLWRRVPIVVALLAGGVALLALALTASAAPLAQARSYPGAAPCDKSLQECINGSAAGDQINIAAGTYVTSFTLNKAVSLVGANMNTTILRALSGQRVLTVTALVTAGTQIANITFEGGTLAAGNGGAMWVQTGAQPSLQNLTIQSGTVMAVSALGGGLFTEASLALTNVTFFQNTAFDGRGGGLAGNGSAHLTLVGVNFNGNGANRDGGGLFANSASITGSTFLANEVGVPGHGGGAFLTGTVAITNSSFIQNQAHENGGGLHAGGNASLSGGSLQSNRSIDERGGALHVGGSLLINGTTITGNQSFDSGGAILVTGTTTLNNALIANNQSTGGSGGALRAVGTAHISNTQFISNAAYNAGGGMRGSVAVFLTNTIFLSNTAGVGGGDNRGGGLFANAAATITGGLFQANSANVGGGANAVGALVVSGTVFSGNVAALNGGGLTAVAANIQNASFVRNQVTAGNGGGLAVTSTLAITRSFFTQNQVLSGTQSAATGSGGGLYGDGVVTSTDNVFLTNYALRLGGGMDADDLQSTWDQFRGNLTGQPGSGGGLFVAGVFNIEGGLFYTNTANTAGGLGVNSTASGNIVNSLFARNVVTFADGGAAMRLLSTSQVNLTHNTMVGTNAPSRAAVHMQGTGDFTFQANIISHFAQGLKQSGAQPTSTVSTAHTVFFSVTSPYVGPVVAGGTDITGTVAYRNAAGNDYRLAPVGAPIDYAPSYGVAVDFEGEARPQGANFDVGFDESLSLLLRVNLPLILR